MDFGNGKKINELMNITKEGNVNIGLQISEVLNNIPTIMAEKLTEMVTPTLAKMQESINEMGSVISTLAIMTKEHGTSIEEINKVIKNLPTDIKDRVSDVLCRDKDFEQGMHEIKHLFNGALYNYPEQFNGSRTVEDNFGEVKRITYRNWNRYILTGNSSFVKLIDGYIYNFFKYNYLPEFYKENSFLNQSENTKVKVIHDFLEVLVNNEQCKSDFIDFILDDFEKERMGKENSRYIKSLFESNENSKFKVRRYLSDRIRFKYYDEKEENKENVINYKSEILKLLGGSVNRNGDWNKIVKIYETEKGTLINCPKGVSKFDYICDNIKDAEYLYNLVKKYIDK